MLINNLEVTWLGFSTVKIKTNKEIIFIDPYAVYSDEKADLILITHEHASHLSNETIGRLAKPDTSVIAPAYAYEIIDHPNKKMIAAGETLEGAGISITAFESYELTRAYAHPKRRGVGYLVEIDKTRIYHGGDTDFVPDLLRLKDIDVACFPIGGFADALGQAVEFINTLHPRFILPIHYNPAKDRKAFALFESKIVNSKIVRA